MATGQVLAGNIIYAADLQDELNALQTRLSIRARSTAATTFTSNTTLANLTGLSCAMAANQVYKIRGCIKVSGANATHDLKIGVTLPAGATIVWACYAGNTSMTGQPVSIDMGTTTATSHTRGTFAGGTTLLIEGFITVAGTAGTVQMQGAQNTSDGGTLSFDAGSEISLELWV